MCRYVVFLEHIPFYSLPSNHQISQVSYLPLFPSASSPPDVLRVYGQRPKILPLVAFTLDPSPLSEPAPDPSIASPTPNNLQRSMRVTKPPDCFGFPSFLYAVHAISIPSSYSQAVQEPCWHEAM